MNRFKVKTWRGFDLTTLKVNKFYDKMEDYNRFNPKSKTTSSRTY